MQLEGGRINDQLTLKVSQSKIGKGGRLRVAKIQVVGNRCTLVTLDTLAQLREQHPLWLLAGGNSTINKYGDIEQADRFGLAKSIGIWIAP